MVRKRSRKYESEDNDSDSDVDFGGKAELQAPAPKKYSLRERKRAPVVPADFDYYGLDDEDGEARLESSDDEDFEIEPEGVSLACPEPVSRTCYDLDTDSTNPDKLIDFEDIIRADIVVNKNKIDYDNLIQKTEIKLTPSDPPKRRGRKPKNYHIEQKHEDTVIKSNAEVQGGDMANLTPLTQGGSEEVKDILQPEVSFSEGALAIPNGEIVQSSEILPSADSLPSKVSTNTEIDVQNEINSSGKDETPQLMDEDDDDVIVLEEKYDIIVLDD